MQYIGNLISEKNEQFDLLKVMLERSKAYPQNKDKSKIIENYLGLPFIYRKGLNKLIITTFFRTLNINDLSIYNVISKQSCMETIIRAIECQLKFIEENKIDIEEIKREEESKMFDVNTDDIAITTCWNCDTNELKTNLKTSDDIIFCYSCGNFYFKGKEYTPDEIKGISRSR